MNLNATIIGQMLAFAIFVVFCMYYVWPPIISALEERKKKITNALAAAERGRHEQKLAEERALQVICKAEDQANIIIAQAQHRSNEILNEAKHNAQIEAKIMLVSAASDIEQKIHLAKNELRVQIGNIVSIGAKKIVSREIDIKDHSNLIEELVSQI